MVSSKKAFIFKGERYDTFPRTREEISKTPRTVNVLNSAVRAAGTHAAAVGQKAQGAPCLLYTSDAADDPSKV